MYLALRLVIDRLMLIYMMGVDRTLLPLSDDAEISIRGAGRGPADQQSLHQLTAPQRMWERSHVEVWRVNNATDHVCNDALTAWVLTQSGMPRLTERLYCIETDRG
jgi:hypothetical protein